MLPLTVNEIREKFLAFFESKDHLRIPSFPLVPHNDNSLLLINSGMAPLKPYFTGQEIPPHPRIATCQKCVRTVDIDEVGRDARHVSFFEMLGNFSFGDYFKEEVIPWAWEFLTETMSIPPHLLYVSVYEEDNEAFDIWHKKIGLSPERIYKLGKKDNFWEHGAGPCGPCSEIYFDRGEKYACGSSDCAVGCDCDRYMEVWNLVFTQFNRLPEGGYEDLASTNIDTGMGLERLAVVMQEASSVFDIDTFQKLREQICYITAITNIPDKGAKESSINIIADHVRSVVFMAADGVLPSNEGRGYILRRLLRRAIRHGKMLGRDNPFVAELIPLVIKQNAEAYPELREREAHILNVLTVEEGRFFATLDTGMSLLATQTQSLRDSGKNMLSGADAFRLYDTYGFPPDLMKEMLAEESLIMDEEGFNNEMQKQRDRARAARGESTYLGTAETIFHQLDAALTTEFVGYDALTVQAKILAIVAGQDAPQTIVTHAEIGDKVAIFLDKTSFYAESGGQKGDKGILTLLEGQAQIEVQDCLKVGAGKIAHLGVVLKGRVAVGDVVITEVNPNEKNAVACNHTATHLLGKALREVLGNHIEQAGSDVSPGRLRFDFTHFSAVDTEQLQRIESIVQNRIFQGLQVISKEMTMDDARKIGAVMLMGEKGEKYGNTVRVVNIGNGESVELCGGTHVNNTSQIGVFKLVSENGVAAGVRRIEAVTGEAAIAQYQKAEELLHEATQLLKTTPDQLSTRINTLTAELKQARQENERLQSKLAEGGTSDILAKSENHAGMTWLSHKLEGMDAASLRTTADKLKDKVDVLLLCTTTNEGSVQFLATASPSAVQAGVHAGNIVKQAASLCGGNGGGRPNNAQAGGKDASKADEALTAGINLAKQQVNK